MDNIHYNFDNTGYKIHLPVVPDVNDPLTKKITDFLDKKFGLDKSSRYDINKGEYRTPYYKVGSGGELDGGKGITFYGNNGSMQEMQELTKEIEQLFGDELADNVKKYNIKFDDPLKLSNSVQARFGVYGFQDNKYPGFDPSLGKMNNSLQYYSTHNPSGAINVKYYTDINGAPGRTKWKSMSVAEREFWIGSSTMYSIDNFGELFTGKVENGKVPQFIMDGLPKEYLQHYNLSEKDIIARINKGTKQIVANMLEDVVNEPKSKILQGNPPWLATLDKGVIDEAKQLLAQHEPETVKKLEQMLPQIEQKCPALAILKQTTPFAQMKLRQVQTPVSNVGNQNQIQAPTKPEVEPNNPVKPNEKPNAKPKTEVGNVEKGWFEKLGKKGKVGVVLAGTGLAALAVYGLAHNSNSVKQEVATNSIQNNTTTINNDNNVVPQTPYNNMYSNTTNPYDVYSRNNSLKIS